MEKSSIVKIVKKVIPAVVSIVISQELPKIERYPLFPFFGFGPFDLPEIPKRQPKKKVKIGGGSGFIVSPDGLILTNRHVVSRSEVEYTVVTNEGKKYSAKILAKDPINDIAFLKIEAKNLPVLELGSSSNLDLGETIIAVGNALGEFQNTVSTGVISGLSRFITAQDGLRGERKKLRGLIQSDAAINPGNSGGPLLNMEGKVIGINAAIVFGAQNIGFALPVNSAKKDLEDLQKYKRIRQPFLGIRYLQINPEIKEKNGLPVDYGALIIPEQLPEDRGVIPGSAAYKSGLKELDIILECNNKKITEEDTLGDLIQEHQIGEVLNFKILRKTQEKIIKVALEEKR